MKPHSHYCQDPNCPSQWDEEGCTNVPREERRPKAAQKKRKRKQKKAKVLQSFGGMDGT